MPCCTGSSFDDPYTFDLGYLLCNDSNPLPPLDNDKEATLKAVARDTAQALINQLLTTCPITKASDDQSLQLTLPPPTTHLPREKPVPKEKEKTRWDKFAEKKGIKGKKRDGKLEFNEELQEWKPKYGYKGKKGDGVQEDWLVEVDDKPEKKKEKGGDVERRNNKIKARKTQQH
ncbi:hypothetical protein B0A48_02579 [Cryoendolithus antarcticus]|uniref:Ribosome biogenesis regulatory protein n=1 Tax=Cryoendolithus antarcticus TaxID=1507870 RepID=A0A1V8TP27_9PEZI|nr:hypothetical protein B0A48_02579 [Cryoendolithus antarcticus]